MSESEMYLSGLSIPEISEKTGVHRSTLRYRFKKKGILRGRAEAIRLAAKKGRMSQSKDIPRCPLSDKTKAKISKSKTGKGKGFSLKPNGYIEHTTGDHKFRSVHVVMMEEKIGRRLYANECVHHKDEDRSNNCIENLKLMTRSEHASHHAKENNHKRIRDKKGRYTNG